MSYQERSSAVSLITMLLILVFYLVNMLQMSQAGGLNSEWIFSLWITVIALGIIANISSNIITQIVLSIFTTIRTKEEATLITDERDKLIGLKGASNSYLAFSLGVFLSMLTLVLGQPPLVMFTLLIFSGLIAEIVGDFSRLYLYRRGV